MRCASYAEYVVRYMCVLRCTICVENLTISNVNTNNEYAKVRIWMCGILVLVLLLLVLILISVQLRMLFGYTVAYYGLYHLKSVRLGSARLSDCYAGRFGFRWCLKGSHVNRPHHRHTCIRLSVKMKAVKLFPHLPYLSNAKFRSKNTVF